MKRITMICAVLIASLSSEGQFSRATLQATGLTCALCSNAINKALQTLPFVQTVRSDIKNSAFTIQFRKETSVDIDALRVAVEDAGFAIGKLQLTGSFDDLKIGNDEHVKLGDSYFHFLKTNAQVLKGEQTITLVEKNFLTASQFKHYSRATRMKCFETGKAASCCNGAAAGTRIYHVTI